MFLWFTHSKVWKTVLVHVCNQILPVFTHLWLDLQKLTKLSQELKSKLKPDTHALSRSINYMAIDSQVCFHRQLFANPVKQCWYITQLVGLLGTTNQNCWGAKSAANNCLNLSCGLCTFLLPAKNIVWLSVPNGRESPPSACPPTLTIPAHSHPPMTL